MKIYGLLFTLMFLFSSLYLTDMFNSVGKQLVLGCIIVIAFMVILFKQKSILYNAKTMFLFYLFTVASCIASLVTSDWQLTIGALSFFVTFFVLSVVFPSIVGENKTGFLLKAILFSQVPLVLVSLYNGIGKFPYKGIFYNPNSFGGVAAMLYAALLVVFLERMTMKRTFFRNTFILVSLCMCFLLVVISGSRTSFLSVAIVTAIGLMVTSAKFVKQNSLGKLIKKIFSTGILLSIVYFLINLVFPLNNYVQNNIIQKFQRKSLDILDERGYVWQKTVRETGLFGNGRDYFTDMEIGAHNTFVSLLGQYGWITLIMFVLFLCYVGIYALKFAFKDEKYSTLPIICLTLFVSLSMAEGMMFKVSMLAAFCCIGVVTVTDRKEVKVEKKEEPQQNILAKYARMMVKN